ncbi:Phosphomutase-like protein 3 [Podospora aff. communis PSN243]|uniref:Phosphomutase-like protein 3 n=1 Tax=Podospora aff. communis PSN243 TaxID=3040156 RepID=A0AAV9GTX3_9PEZI|nr:Phosphomutase-like protein 3 [Podospora aff. communis PSN243]
MATVSQCIMALLGALLCLSTPVFSVSFTYTTPRGFFLQEDPSLNSSPPDYTKISYGLLNRSYPTDQSHSNNNNNSSPTKPPWSRFTDYLTALNRNNRNNPTNNNNNTTYYKLLYLARHGEAHHNVAQSYYGTKCWDCYWSQQPGNGTKTWLDAEMTTRGVAQIQASNVFWRDVAPAEEIPFPRSFYVSPMARTLATANLTFASLPVWNGSGRFKPVVKESLRETINQCTCAWRHPRSRIAARFPDYEFEEGFSEEDDLFTGKTIESASAQALRIKGFLDDLFENDESLVVSVTTHGVNINPLLGVVGHPNPRFNITTGQAVAMLVAAQRVEGEKGGVGEPPVSAEVCGVCGPVG